MARTASTCCSTSVSGIPPHLLYLWAGPADPAEVLQRHFPAHQRLASADDVYRRRVASDFLQRLHKPARYADLPCLRLDAPTVPNPIRLVPTRPTTGAAIVPIFRHHSPPIIMRQRTAVRPDVPCRVDVRMSAGRATAMDRGVILAGANAGIAQAVCNSGFGRAASVVVFVIFHFSHFSSPLRSARFALRFKAAQNISACWLRCSGNGTVLRLRACCHHST